MSPALAQLKEILAHGEAQLASKDEVARLFRVLISGIQAWQKKQEKEMAFARTSLVQEVQALERKLSEETTAANRESIAKDRSFFAETKKLIADIEAKIPMLPDLSYLEEKILAIQPAIAIDLEKEMPKYGEPIRDSLELLPKGEKLNIDAIEDLREELDKVRNIQLTKKDNVVYVGGGGGSGGRIVKSYDTFTLNGVTKTFSLPAFYRIISVHSSSFPNAFKLTTDYTVDGSNFQITFTSAIEASTTLAEGQTIVVIYAEA